MRERGTHERSVVESILDEGIVCHVGVVDGSAPIVSPMAYARLGTNLYLHGAARNRTLDLLASGSAACVTVTLVDGLVLARAAVHHSMNYRCVMLFGVGATVEDPEEKLAASTALLERMVPGRSTVARAPSVPELRATTVVRFPIDEGSAKVRTGGPKDDPEDLSLPVWAGVIPLELRARPGVAEPDLAVAAPAPTVALGSRPNRSEPLAP
jgi:nitroimidazol reductase NimA-like FMN-containing flavoprotein (pyridoxamine 5'-phosphate oxidase superfamily)